MKLLNLVGQTFGRLTVQSLVGSVKNKKVWLCLCSCGKQNTVPTAMLRCGSTKSCGCLGIEARSAATSKSNKTHGMSKTQTYSIWFNMRRRCEQKSHKSYCHYGGRGIIVCDRWKTFHAFFEDMGEAPVGLSIERKDVNGNYEPSNCCWATMKEQSNNRRTNHVLSAFGEKKTMQQWAESSGISYHALSKRIGAGWPVEEAVSKPMKSDRRRVV